MIQVIDGVQQPFTQQRGKDLRLVAYWSQTDDRGFEYMCERVVLETIQTKASLTRILLSMFVLHEAEKVFAVWQSPVYEDTRITKSLNHRLIDVAQRPHLQGMDKVG